MNLLNSGWLGSNAPLRSQLVNLDCESACNTDPLRGGFRVET